MTHPTTPSYRKGFSPAEIEARKAEYFIACSERGIEPGTCFCRCGQKTRIASINHLKGGYVKGVPVRLIRGHKLSGVTGTRYTCAICGSTKAFSSRRCKDCWGVGRGKDRIIDSSGGSTRRIHLGGEEWAIVDSADYDWLMRWRWYACRNNNGDVYARNGECGKMHRFIMGVRGRWVLVDHKRKPTTDNRRCNLRVTDAFGNNQNRVIPITNKTGYKGVDQLANGLYRAQIAYRHKKYNLGSYATPAKAHEIYVAKALELHQQFANFG